MKNSRWFVRSGLGGLLLIFIGVVANGQRPIDRWMTSTAGTQATSRNEDNTPNEIRSGSKETQPQKIPLTINGASDKAILSVTNNGAYGGGGVGVSGTAPAGNGVEGIGLTGVSGKGSNKGTGLYGYADNGIGVNGYGGEGGKGVYGAGRYGIQGNGTSNDSVGVWGTNSSGGLAGKFDGPVYVLGALRAERGLAVNGGCAGCSPPSDRNLKANFSRVNSRFILDRLSTLPVQIWNYKSDANSVRHLGPTAQDFRAAFGLGDSDKIINTVDADGVALAAIQALYQVIQERDQEIELLKKRLSTLERAANRRATIRQRR